MRWSPPAGLHGGWSLEMVFFLRFERGLERIFAVEGVRPPRVFLGARRRGVGAGEGKYMRMKFYLGGFGLVKFCIFVRI